MAYDIGDVIPLSVIVRDDTGAPADAGAVVCTVTAPDGTTSTPAVTHAGTGHYIASHVAATPGPHGYRFVATGANACAFADGFTVAAAGVPLLGLADVKTFLNITDTTSDEELRQTIAASTALAEKYCARALSPRLWTGIITAKPGAAVLVLPEPSATSIVSIVADSGTVDPADYRLDPTGQNIHALNGQTWTGDHTVTAMLGVSGADLDAAQQGVRELIRHAWLPQRGAAPIPLQGAMMSGNPTPGAAYAFPYVVTEKLDLITLPGGFG